MSMTTLLQRFGGRADRAMSAPGTLIAFEAEPEQYLVGKRLMYSKAKNPAFFNVGKKGRMIAYSRNVVVALIILNSGAAMAAQEDGSGTDALREAIKELASAWDAYAQMVASPSRDSATSKKIHNEIEMRIRELAKHGEPAVETLISYLAKGGSVERQVRGATVKSFPFTNIHYYIFHVIGKEGLRGALPVVRKTIEDPDADALVRESAIGAARAMKDREAIPALKRAWHEMIRNNWRGREDTILLASWTLMELGEQPHLEEAVLRALTNETPSVSQRVAMILIKIWKSSGDSLSPMRWEIVSTLIGQYETNAVAKETLRVLTAQRFPEVAMWKAWLSQNKGKAIADWDGIVLPEDKIREISANTIAEIDRVVRKSGITTGEITWAIHAYGLGDAIEHIIRLLDVKERVAVPKGAFCGMPPTIGENALCILEGVAFRSFGSLSEPETVERWKKWWERAEKDSRSAWKAWKQSGVDETIRHLQKQTKETVLVYGGNGRSGPQRMIDAISLNATNEQIVGAMSDRSCPQWVRISFHYLLARRTGMRFGDLNAQSSPEEVDAVARKWLAWIESDQKDAGAVDEK